MLPDDDLHGDTLDLAPWVHLHGVLDTAGEAFVGITADGRINGWNAAAEALLGWTAEEVMGQPILDCIASRSWRSAYGSGSTALFLDQDDLPPMPVDITVQHRDGHAIWVEARIGRVRHAGTWQMHAFLRDSTDRRATEQSLARSETLHRILAENSADLITRHSADGKFLYASPACHSLLGWTPAELLRLDPWELLHPSDAAALRGMAEESAPPPGEVTFRLRHREGRWVWVEAMYSVLRDSAGAIEEFQICTRDVTDRKAREDKLQQESKLESLGRLSAGLAHEINSPIQFVGDNARFLAEAYQDLIRIVLFYRGLLASTDAIGWEDRLARMRVAEEGIEFEYLQSEIPSAVEQTLLGIERVSTIVRAMKTFSHPGHREQAPADLNEALEATVTVTRHQVSSVAELRLELADLPPVRCNIADLNQVFLNLIVNAADAIADTGTPGVIRVATELDDDQAVITISDTGSGIPDDVRPKIFDPFFTTKDVGQGSGQGLPLARAVVHDGHGGLLSVDSKVGVGTTFTIHLPVGGRG